MAIAGAATNSFEAQIVDGRLVLDRQSLRQGVETHVDDAVIALLSGEKIYLHAFYPTMEGVKNILKELGVEV